ncbi:MAG: laccase domain-containing protein [Bacteroidota bacterium]
MAHLRPPMAPRDISELPEYLRFRVGHSTVTDGNMSYSFGPRAAVLLARQRFFAGQDLPPERLIPFFTEHREIITDIPAYDFDGCSLSHPPRFISDANVLQIPGAGIFLGFADCVPFVVYDARQHLLAFAHVGWRSMAAGLTGKLLRHLMQHHGSRPQDLYGVIGPSIKPESYRFADPIQAQNRVWQPFLRPQPDGRTGIDLYGFCTQEVHSAGVPPDQLYAFRTDTATDPTLFSHYAATVNGQRHKQGRFFFYGWLDE